MTLPLITQPAAEEDVDDAAEYISADNPSAGARFLVQVEESLTQLLSMPELGRLREYSAPHLAGIRSLPVRKFENWLVFYRTTRGAIVVIRVLHGARDIESVLTREIGDTSDAPNNKVT